jgi:hypothetical protein
LLIDIPERQARRARRKGKRNGATDALGRTRDHDNVVPRKAAHDVAH